MRTDYRIRRALVLLAFAVIGMAACRADAITFVGRGNRSFVVAKGADFTIVLQTIGPGEYGSPPTVSSTSVRFIDVSQATVEVPAGPTQQFRFQAVSSGQAVIGFQHSGFDPPVSDTVVVR